MGEILREVVTGIRERKCAGELVGPYRVDALIGKGVWERFTAERTLQRPVRARSESDRVSASSRRLHALWRRPELPGDGIRRGRYLAHAISTVRCAVAGACEGRDSSNGAKVLGFGWRSWARRRSSGRLSQAARSDDGIGFDRRLACITWRRSRRRARTPTSDRILLLSARCCLKVLTGKRTFDGETRLRFWRRF
jgi:hypothetical protein